MSIQFKRIPSEDPSTDAEYDLIEDGRETGIAIQDGWFCGGGYAITLHSGSVEKGTIAMQILGTAPTLAQAKTLARAYVTARRTMN